MKLSVGESKPHKFKLCAWLIMLVEGTNPSHSFITWKDERIGVRKVAEAIGSGGKMLTNHEFKSKNKITNIYYYEIDQKSMDELEVWLWNNMRPYGFQHIVGLLYMRLCAGIKRLFKNKSKCKNPLKDGTFSQICVELSARSIEKSKNIDLPGNIEDYGLQEMHNINEKYSDSKASQEKIDRINKNK